MYVGRSPLDLVDQSGIPVNANMPFVSEVPLAAFFRLMSVWIAMYIDWIFRGICFFIRYRGHEWEHAMLK